MTFKVLIAEDARDIANAVAYGIRMTWPSSQVTIVSSGTEALQHFHAKPSDLAILDINLPPPDGFEVCRRIRETSQVPILVLTIRDDTLDKVRALDLGADDYLTKPFDHLELLARLRALVRRSSHMSSSSGTALTVGDLVLNPLSRTAQVKDKVVPLTSTEYRLLEELVRHAGHVLSHQFLLEHVWGPEYATNINYLKVFIRRLRQKLGNDPESPCYIQTEWGIGYRFVSLM